MRVNPAIAACVLRLLREEYRGHLAAVVGDDLVLRVEVELGYRPNVRRIQEAVAALVTQGHPIASSSVDPAGYFWPETPEEVAGALAELERRTAGVARRRAALKRALAAMKPTPQLVLGFDR